MSSETLKHVSGRKVFWRSLETKDAAAAQPEHERGSDIVKQTIDAGELGRLKRRHFLTLSGAISALAGIEGCIRRPVERILPYTQAPEDVSPGVPAHYASAIRARGEALGVLVRSYEGRPTKIEGNPDHPASRGATDLLTQASIMDLYDTDRARGPSRLGVSKSYADLDAELRALTEKLAKDGGVGLHVLSEPTASPTFLRLRAALKLRMPQAHFHTYSPLSDANERAGIKLAFGQALVAHHQMRNAKVILSLDSDFLLTEPSAVRAGRDFAQGRHMGSARDAGMNRLYVVEPAMSVTGSNADHRLRLSAQAVGAYAKALAAELGSQGVSLGIVGGALGSPAVPGVPSHWIKAVARDLATHRGESLVVVGSRQPPAVHALAHAINSALQNAGRTVTYVAPVDIEQGDSFADIAALSAEMAAGHVQTLIVLGGNPAHDAPADAGFKQALAKVPMSLALTRRLDETGAACTWHVPLAHDLETWGDQLSRDGYYAVQQPLIAPLFGALSEVELLARLAGESDPSGHALVRATATARGVGDELAWRHLLQKGVSEASYVQMLGGLPVQEEVVAGAVRSIEAPAAGGPSNLEVVFQADNKLLDGRYANNAWLLEMPDPITRITWDNVAAFAPSTARALGLKNGDMIRLQVGEASLDIPAWLQPGQAAGSIGLTLGWGRKLAGHNAAGAGFDVYPLRTSKAPHFAGGVKVEKLGRSYKISQTQDHDSMEGRPVAIDATLAEYRKQADFAQWEAPDPSTPPLWKRVEYDKGHQWGMVIDLNTCTGCSACVIACQSENNIPIVGKEQIARGREMSWIRIDRYYVGEDADEPEVAFQPVGCQHCEEAPCENVCPVAATSHSPEGLNDMAYNRCIGTRYCMNNCPYKVRRFNFFNFNLDIPETQKMQYNPSVSLRFRGVMEKCTYCVQRVEAGKIGVRREGRAMRDGDIVTACQQACPAQAITFGDINDPNSAVAKKRKVDRAYGLLADVGTHPRTRFLGKIRNPNPEMKG